MSGAGISNTLSNLAKMFYKDLNIIDVKLQIDETKNILYHFVDKKYKTLLSSKFD